ncbi:hypothetical protein E2C01_010444 [Portunus trituberculatus]|uniref:Uncharacterized protein n=1 Tax=Portunus trituberculatus TaxID=210409 RepID=A0A5B7D8G4_PORTR|nr:hypothetical protein [Portunus trituberculatus]
MRQKTFDSTLYNKAVSVEPPPPTLRQTRTDKALVQS